MTTLHPIFQAAVAPWICLPSAVITDHQRIGHTHLERHAALCSQCGGSFNCSLHTGFSSCIAHRKALASNPVEVFSAALQDGYKPNAEQMRDFLYVLHEATLDLPEMLWLSTNCEDLADAYASAIRCAEMQDDEPIDDGWMLRQDRAAAGMVA